MKVRAPLISIRSNIAYFKMKEFYTIFSTKYKSQVVCHQPQKYI